MPTFQEFNPELFQNPITGTLFNLRVYSRVFDSKLGADAQLNSTFQVQGSKFKVQGSRFEVQGSGFRIVGSLWVLDSSYTCSTFSFSPTTFRAESKCASRQVTAKPVRMATVATKRSSRGMLMPLERSCLSSSAAPRQSSISKGMCWLKPNAV
ncbi:MAG: hypothetical protein C5B50_16975 [Verrucomicrobia bacterium]|nr:MAG: hypothetical protein C5B50_16975 [Verrucomicrobiota bacterium]